MESIITNLVGNGAIGAVLVWFMIQNRSLIEKLFEQIRQGNDVIGKNTQVMEDVKNVITKCNK